jgi:hypothetical protein
MAPFTSAFVLLVILYETQCPKEFSEYIFANIQHLKMLCVCVRTLEFQIVQGGRTETWLSPSSHWFHNRFAIFSGIKSFVAAIKNIIAFVVYVFLSCP